jgi:hypothetical protein
MTNFEKLAIGGALIMTLAATGAQAGEIRRDRLEIRHDRRKLRHDRGELRGDRREIRHDAKLGTLEATAARGAPAAPRAMAGHDSRGAAPGTAAPERTFRRRALTEVD